MPRRVAQRPGPWLLVGSIVIARRYIDRYSLILARAALKSYACRHPSRAGNVLRTGKATVALFRWYEHLDPETKYEYLASK